MRQDSLLYPFALLASVQTAHALPGAAAADDVAVVDDEPLTTSLSLRDEDTSVQPYEYDGQTSPVPRRRRRSIDWNRLVEECPNVMREMKKELSTLPRWIMQPIGYSGAAMSGAWTVCHQLGYRDCRGPVMGGVTVAFPLIFNALSDNMEGGPKHQGARPAEAPNGPQEHAKSRRDGKLATRRRHQHAVRMIEDTLLKSASSTGGSALRYDSIAEVQPSAGADAGFSHLAARRLADNGGYAVDIRGLTLGSDGPAMDHRFTSRGDGTGDVQIRPSVPAGVARRADHAGFKISYKVVEDGDLGLEPDADGVDWASDTMAQDWAKRADENHNMGDYIAAVTMGDSGTVVQFRVIPEKGGFGENYEDVNTCN
ncbi:hypothetical protein PG997_011511 [Apiospora hydei]|uniref:Uncharacterized protein n=1 Tax=Apiospora hydei TaxID=1337664 RepID=A0ABR1VJ88_9PEZI